MEPIVRTFLPLYSWQFQKMFGPFFSPSGWRAVALSVSPPPDNLVNVITMECGDWNSPALLSPTGRRRIRNHAKRHIWRQLRHDPHMLLVREWLLKWRQELEDTGYTEDPARVGKIRDAQDETNKRFQDSLQGNDLPEELAQIVRESPDAVNLLWELAIHGGTTLNKPKLRRNSPVWALFDLDPERLKSLPPKEGFLLLLSRLKSLFGWNDAPPSEFTVLKMVRWLVRVYLPSDQERETTPEALSKATIAGLIHKPIVIRDKETGKVVEMDIEDTSALQVGELSEADSREAIIEAFAHKGIGYNDLTPNEWQEIFERRDLFRKGLEFSSKTGVSISSFYGTDAHAKEQKWSRIKKKIRDVHKTK